MKLTVITTAYNAEKYIEESLESLSDQSFKDFNLVLVDDGSTDKTKEILINYSNSRSNVIFLENKSNMGVPYSRNKALLHSNSEYIAIHDADDISLKHRFETQVNYLDNNRNIAFIGSYAKRISDLGENMGDMIYPPKNTGDAFSMIVRFKLNPIIDPTSMYRRNIIINHGGYTSDPLLRTAQDFELWCRLLCHGYSMANIQDFLIHYRINPNGVTRIEKKAMLEATDIIWSKFRRKTFSDPVFNEKMIKEDTIGDLWNE